MSDIQHKTLQARFNEAKCLWTEDECAPDAENESHAWHRLFGEDLPKVAIAKEDYGDCEIFEYPNGRLLQVGPPRSGITEIRVTEKEATVTPDPIRRLAERIDSQLKQACMAEIQVDLIEKVLRREGVRMEALGELQTGQRVSFTLRSKKYVGTVQRDHLVHVLTDEGEHYIIRFQHASLPDAAEKDDEVK